MALSTDSHDKGIHSHRRGHLLRWGGLATGMATLVLAVVLASRFGTDPQLVASPLIGQPAPDVNLPRLDGDGNVPLKTSTDR